MNGLIKTKTDNQHEINVVLSKKNSKKFTPPSVEGLIIRYLKGLNLVLARGRSSSREVLPAYLDLITNVRSHFESSERLVCYLCYSVINATTTKLLFNLFKVMQDAHRDDKDVTVYWAVAKANKELIDIGLELKSFVNFKFHFIQP